MHKLDTRLMIEPAILSMKKKEDRVAAFSLLLRDYVVTILSKDAYHSKDKEDEKLTRKTIKDLTSLKGQDLVKWAVGMAHEIEEMSGPALFFKV